MDGGRRVIWQWRLRFRCARNSRGFTATVIRGWKRSPEHCRLRARFALRPIWDRCRCREVRRSVTYIIRKRSYAPSQEAARRQFEQMRISAIKNADGDFIEGRLLNRNLRRFSAEFLVQIPRKLEVVKVETRGGPLNFSSIVATVLGATGGGSVTLDDLDGSVKNYQRRWKCGGRPSGLRFFSYHRWRGRSHQERRRTNPHQHRGWQSVCRFLKGSRYSNRRGQY